MHDKKEQNISLIYSYLEAKVLVNLRLYFGNCQDR